MFVHRVSLHLFLSFIFFLIFDLNGQTPKSILGDTALLSQIKIGLDNIYNTNLEEALKTYDILKEERPIHPVTPFFYGLALYWGKNHRVFEMENFNEFIDAMEETFEKAKPLWEEDENSIEGVFFDLVARAMLMMYYSDKGHSARVIKIAPTAYRHLLKSFDLKQAFKEFYFITGLYSYYIEAYPEKNPVYKPISLIFRNGDKELGLEELQYAMDSTVYMKNEAGMFLAIIYYDFEKDTEKAIQIMEHLYNEYPKNPYMASQYAEFLLNNGQYEECLAVCKNMVRQNRSHGYIVMKAIILKALVEEKYKKDYEKAYENYELGLKIAEKYGDQANDFTGYAYYGLSRLESLKENNISLKQNDVIVIASKVVSVVEGAVLRFAQLQRLAFYGPGEVCMSKWAIDME